MILLACGADAFLAPDLRCQDVKCYSTGQCYEDAYCFAGDCYEEFKAAGTPCKPSAEQLAYDRLRLYLDSQGIKEDVLAYDRWRQYLDSHPVQDIPDEWVDEERVVGDYDSVGGDWQEKLNSWADKAKKWWNKGNGKRSNAEVPRDIAGTQIRYECKLGKCVRA